ncbi:MULTISPECIES: hypothetical protein [unclassified Methylobacterium]|uniref:hypothetical protein n=1 Tax=unclassified Methylobacterium TaxID=2615210 RepID=UPI0036F4BE4F
MHAIIACLNADKLKATPHVVPQPGLLRTVMGDDAFLKALDERRRWIAERCRGSSHADNLRDERGGTVGKLYRFEQELDACAFRMTF